MIRAELERRVRVVMEAKGDDPDACEVEVDPYASGCDVRVYTGNDVSDVNVGGATEDAACDKAWAVIVTRLCDDVTRARRVLDAARWFDAR